MRSSVPGPRLKDPVTHRAHLRSDLTPNQVANDIGLLYALAVCVVAVLISTLLT